MHFGIVSVLLFLFVPYEGRINRETYLSGLFHVPSKNQVADTDGKSPLPILSLVFIFCIALRYVVRSCMFGCFSTRTISTY